MIISAIMRQGCVGIIGGWKIGTWLWRGGCVKSGGSRGWVPCLPDSKWTSMNPISGSSLYQKNMPKYSYGDSFSLIPSLLRPLTHSLTHLLTHSLTYSHNHTFIHQHLPSPGLHLSACFFFFLSLSHTDTQHKLDKQYEYSVFCCCCCVFFFLILPYIVLPIFSCCNGQQAFQQVWLSQLQRLAETETVEDEGQAACSSTTLVITSQGTASISPVPLRLYPSQNTYRKK